jgi:SWI/SNF-related matrix-associated actin-dependent regulator of chromatin subfamily A-like protein 1
MKKRNNFHIFHNNSKSLRSTHKITKLYKFQNIDIKYVYSTFDGKGLLCWSPGLGKTVASAVYAKRYIGGTIVVVCPATIKTHWQREMAKHCNIRADILNGRTPPLGMMGLKTGRAYIINYDILDQVKSRKKNSKRVKPKRNWVRKLKLLKPELVIVDECQAVKSRTTTRTRAVAELCKGVKHLLFLSGTPILNRPVELFPILNMLKPDLFPDFIEYARRYCDPQWHFWGWSYLGSTNIEELNQILLGNIMVRRRKEDVLKDLPARTISVVPFALTGKAKEEYVEAETAYRVWLYRVYYKAPEKIRRALAAERLTKIGNLKRLAGRLKVPQVIKWVDDYLQESQDKLLLFGIHHRVLNAFFDVFSKISVMVTGKVVGEHRQAAIDKLNNDAKCRMMIGNIQAAGTGWSCKNAAAVVIAEPPWTPGESTQAMDRAHGIGRGGGMPLNAYFLVAEDTIEEDICAMTQKKQDVVDQVLDGKVTGILNIYDQLDEKIMARGEAFTRRPRLRQVGSL